MNNEYVYIIFCHRACIFHLVLSFHSTIYSIILPSYVMMFSRYYAFEFGNRDDFLH